MACLSCHNYWESPCPRCSGDVGVDNESFINNWFCGCEDGDIVAGDILYDGDNNVESIVCGVCGDIFELFNGDWKRV